MIKYYRVMLGQQGTHAADCQTGNFVGVDYGVHWDLSNEALDDWRAFKTRNVPRYLEQYPDKSKIAASFAVGAVWTMAKGFQVGDILICNLGDGQYRLARVTGPYHYAAGPVLQHRRSVEFLSGIIERSNLSDGLKRKVSNYGAIVAINNPDFIDELQQLLNGEFALIALPAAAEPAAMMFRLEQHLEDFLVHNWANTPFGATHQIYRVDGEIVGQQFHVDTGRIDILAVSNDGNEILVIELKRGRTSDATVGQILRYMAYVQEELAEPHQVVRGLVIALDDDLNLRRALSMVPNVRFARYQVHFSLVEA